MRNIKKLKPKTRIMEDLNTSYVDELRKLNLFEFISLIMTVKIVNSIYVSKKVAKYYLMLGFRKLYKQFINFFLNLYIIPLEDIIVNSLC